MDFGCGAGAFLKSLGKIIPGIHVYGIDYSAPLVALARKHVTKNTSGHFWRGDVRDVSFISEEEFDHAISFSVFQYLNSLNDVLRTWSEMARVTKVGGSVIIADVSDKSLESVYLAKLRGNSDYEKKKLKDNKSSDTTPEHLFISKSFFLENAASLGVRVDKIMDEKKCQQTCRSTNLQPIDTRFTLQK